MNDNKGAISIAVVLFLLHKYQVLGKALRISAIGAVVLMSSLSAQERETVSQNSLIAACKAKDASLSTAQCATWLRRADYARNASCPDTSATAACTSFRELLRTSDVDLLDDFAQQDHLYICFRPNQDVFMEIDFTDASDGVWQRDDKIHSRVEHLGGAGITYYKDGIGSGDMSFHDIGNWAFSIAELPNDDISMIRQLPADTAFRGDRILIQGSHFEANETYKNTGGMETVHSLTLQLSTGRFVESYEMKSSSDSGRTYTGRCLVLPPAPN